MLQFSIYSAIDSPNQGLSIELLTNQKYAREGKKKWSMPDFAPIRGYLPLVASLEFDTLTDHLLKWPASASSTELPYRLRDATCTVV